MAVDIVPRNATGAALGVVGMASYIAAGLQDVISGTLIENFKVVSDGVVTYDFLPVSILWIGASILSFVLALFGIIMFYYRQKKLIRFYVSAFFVCICMRLFTGRGFIRFFCRV